MSPLTNPGRFRFLRRTFLQLPSAVISGRFGRQNRFPETFCRHSHAVEGRGFAIDGARGRWSDGSI